MPESQGVDSPIPRALLRSPRMVRRKPGTIGPVLLGRIITTPVLAVFAATLGFAVLEPTVVFLLPAQPAQVVGQRRVLKSRRGTVYCIEYQFDLSGFTGHDEVLPEEYRAYHVGQAVKAHLLRLGPFAYSALDRSLKTYARDRMILWVGALFACATGGVLYYAVWLMPWRSHWLTRHGQATFGAVVEKSIVRTGRRQLNFTLTYQFKARGALRGRRIRISSQRYDSAGVKDLVIILFDPTRPSRNIVYDYCDFIVS